MTSNTRDTTSARMGRQKTILVFGAGAVGRGLLGDLFSSAGWLVSYLDVDPSIVEALRRNCSYQLRTVGRNESVTRVGPVTAGYSTDPSCVLAEVARADVIATAVGAAALPEVASALRTPLLARMADRDAPVDILLCENVHDAAGLMRKYLMSDEPRGVADMLNDRVGLVETSIGRMIPASESGSTRGDATTIAVEPYRFLPVDAAAMRGEALNVAGVIHYSGDFSFYSERKLYVHNMAHYMCGLLGKARGLQFVWQAVADTGIRYFMRAAMLEVCVALAAHHGQPLAALMEHVDDLLHRFGNVALADPVTRVVRDPRRKMGPTDRLAGAMAVTTAMGLPSRHLSLGVAAGTLELELAEGWSRMTAEAFVQDVIQPSESAWVLLRSQLASLREHGFDVQEQMALIGQEFEPPALP